MNITNAERLAIQEVLAYGETFGFGNLITHLQTAWARMLMAKYDMPEKAARSATARDGSGYPFKMQNDLVEHGFWDETGDRYRRKSPRTVAAVRKPRHRTVSPARVKE